MTDRWKRDEEGVYSKRQDEQAGKIMKIGLTGQTLRRYKFSFLLRCEINF